MGLHFFKGHLCNLIVAMNGWDILCPRGRDSGRIARSLRSLLQLSNFVSWDTTVQIHRAESQPTSTVALHMSRDKHTNIPHGLTSLEKHFHLKRHI